MTRLLDGDELTVALLEALAGKPGTAFELAAAIGEPVTQVNVARIRFHLTGMEQQGLVQRYRADGRVWTWAPAGEDSDDEQVLRHGSRGPGGTQGAARVHGH